MPKAATRPFLVTKGADGTFRITRRETRYNSQRFPIVSSTLLDDTFKSAAAAREYVKTEFGGLAADVEVARS